MLNYIIFICFHIYICYTTIFLKYFLLFPFFIAIYFIILIFNLMYLSLWNIFKFFFFTESILLIVVLFLSQFGIIFNLTLEFSYFYCQLILGVAAAEAALFLGLFAYLYQQQVLDKIMENELPFFGNEKFKKK